MYLRLAVKTGARMRGLLGCGAGEGVRDEAPSPSCSARATGWPRTACGHAGAEEVLLIAPCRRIHTVGMRFALDVAFIDAQGLVLRSLRGLVPGRLPAGCRGAAAVLERRASDKGWFVPGQQVMLGAGDEGSGQRQKRKRSSS